MSSKHSALEKKRPVASIQPVKKPVKKSVKTVEVKLQDPSEEEKRARVVAAFTTPPDEVLKNFRKISKEKKKAAPGNKSARVSTANFLAKPPAKGRKYSMDLRIHTPGTVGYFVSGGINPAPALSRLAKVKGLDIIGLTDFHDAALVDQITIQAKDADVTILPGVDLRCELSGCNEVYLIVLFEEGTSSSVIYSLLDELQIPAAARGRKGYTVSASVAKVIAAAEARGGVIIPSRMDKTPFRQLAIPALVDQFGFRVFDLVHPESKDLFKDRWPDGGFTFLSFSNADALAQIGTRTTSIKLASAGFGGLQELLKRRV